MQTIKIVVLGINESGKSSLIQKYVGNKYTDSYSPTLNSQLYHTFIKMNKINIQLDICDGKSEFSNLESETQAIIFVYTEAAEKEGFKYIKSMVSQYGHIPCILVCAKSDLNFKKEKPTITLGIQTIANIYCSSKINTNIDRLFFDVCELVIKSKETSTLLQRSKSLPSQLTTNPKALEPITLKTKPPVNKDSVIKRTFSFLFKKEKKEISTITKSCSFHFKIKKEDLCI